MDIFYRPTLENPPMAEECNITFSFIKGDQSPESITISSGVNRGIDPAIWDKLKDRPYVKRLLGLGALAVEFPDTESNEDDEDKPRSADLEDLEGDSLINLSIPKALVYIERSIDETQLRRWYNSDARIGIRNPIKLRLEAIAAGKG